MNKIEKLTPEKKYELPENLKKIKSEIQFHNIFNQSESNIKLSYRPKQFGDGQAKNITFIVTEDCNLACKYCYLTGKNSKNKMSFEIAKKAVDFFLDNKNIFDEESVIWEFIGGEPTLEIDLIDRISDYIKLQMYYKKHKWFNSYRFNFSTNGLLYHTEKVQKYILKNKKHLSIGMSIDGNRLKHDQQRVKPDGSGSYDDIISNVPLWLKQFPESGTKATFSSDDLPLLKDSIISLCNSGIKVINANVIFENVWKDGDDKIFEDQIKQLGDYVLEKKLWDKFYVSFLYPDIGYPLTKAQKYKNFCGSGRMLAVNYEGSLYPCVRFVDYSLNNKEPLCFGNIFSGIDLNKVRSFELLDLNHQGPQDCIDCEISSGCALCVGLNYDEAKTDTIFERSIYNCKMHKANVKANIYFWNKYTKVTGLQSEREKLFRGNIENLSESNDAKYMIFIYSNNIASHCNYKTKENDNIIMNDILLEKGLEFAFNVGFIPVLLGYSNQINKNLLNKFHYIINNQLIDLFPEEKQIIIKNLNSSIYKNNSIIQLTKNDFNILKDFSNKSKIEGRINIYFQDIEEWNDRDFDTYKSTLKELNKLVFNYYKNNDTIEINLLTDIFNKEEINDCGAGEDSIYFAPNGNFYICPGFYFDNENDSIGNLDIGINIKNKRLLEVKNTPLCSMCDSFQCLRCKYLNKKLTNEIGVPSKNQCVKSHIERNNSMELLKELKKIKYFTKSKMLKKLKYLDPFNIYFKNKSR
jgi:uncharacterized protein